MSYPTSKEVYDILREREVFDEEVTGFNFFPGTDPNVTAEQIADTIQNALASIQRGEGRDINLGV